MDTATKTGPNTLQTISNQCLFLRGYRVALKTLSPGTNRFEAQILPIMKLKPQDLKVERDDYIPFGVSDVQEILSPNIAGASNKKPSVRDLPAAHPHLIF